MIKGNVVRDRRQTASTTQTEGETLADKERQKQITITIWPDNEG